MNERQRINESAGRCHELSRQILGIDWYDTESQARRVIEAMATSEKPLAIAAEKFADQLRGSLYKSDAPDSVWTLLKDLDDAIHAHRVREVPVEVDVYEHCCEVIEPYVRRPTNPEGFLPASVADSMEFLLEEFLNSGAAVAAIKYALEECSPHDECVEFLRTWNEGEFDTLRRNWPNIPDEVFIGAEAGFVPGGAQCSK